MFEECLYLARVEERESFDGIVFDFVFLDRDQTLDKRERERERERKKRGREV